MRIGSETRRQKVFARASCQALSEIDEVSDNYDEDFSPRKEAKHNQLHRLTFGEGKS
jgi:hypothetical protein